MKQIIDIPDELFSIFKKHGITAFDYVNEYDKDQIAIAITHGVPYNPSGDCISREAVRSKIWKERVEKDEGCNSEYIRGLKTAVGFIDNAQAVNTDVVADNVIKAHENIGYEQGFNDGYAKCVEDNDRPKGEWIDDSPTSWKCSCCGYGVNRWNNTPFCPNCGASMKGGVENG